jgi:hypothetical protein
MTESLKINLIISFISIPWIRTGLQNPYGYRNSQPCEKEIGLYIVHFNGAYHINKLKCELKELYSVLASGWSQK